MKRDDMVELVGIALAVGFCIAVGVITFREWRSCRAKGGALVQAVDWPPVACIERKGAR